MQYRLVAVWDQLVASGIDNYIKQQNLAFYKTIRSDWLYRMHLQTNTDELINYEGYNTTVILLLVVLGIGYSMAILAFGIELVW